MILLAAPGGDHDPVIKDAILALEPSAQLMTLLEEHDSFPEAITAYKKLVLHTLASTLRGEGAAVAVSEAQDDALFNEFLSKSPDALPVKPSQVLEVQPGLTIPEARLSKKRGSSVVMAEPLPAVIPKKLKSSIPALAALSTLSSSSDSSGQAKKRTLLTREKLRAGLHDPRGLPDLEGASTNALDRTKRLELQKSAGYDFEKKRKSFSDKLNGATLRLELGLGGHSVEDTLLFGTKVLSLPGSLSRKNISDVENNVVHGSTSWKHQEAYARMVIAGCVNQAKRILASYDEVLYGPPPEKLVAATHKAIADLLVSEEARAFLGTEDDESPSPPSPEKERFIKKIIGSISPIIPITIRNKSLDGSYLRTALHMLWAAEVFLARYVTEIRN